MLINPVTLEIATGLKRGDIVRTTKYPDGSVYPEFKDGITAANKTKVSDYLATIGVAVLTEPKVDIF